jgi:hypothetical protein
MEEEYFALQKNKMWHLVVRDDSRQLSMRSHVVVRDAGQEGRDEEVKKTYIILSFMHFHSVISVATHGQFP